MGKGMGSELTPHPLSHVIIPIKELRRRDIEGFYRDTGKEYGSYYFGSEENYPNNGESNGNGNSK